LEALADQAAIALTNARLRSEIRQRQAKIERLNRALAERLESSEGELKRVKGELEKRTDELIFRYRYDEIIARSKPMTALFRLLDRVVTGDYPVIIQGESGTGKELVARAIHFNSCRKRRPFVAENCAAIPDTLLESVLFGHVKGAFTGAVTDAPGLFVEADQGTLFLDEIGEMSLGMQAKLLRVLQNGEVRPVGGAKTRNVDVRVLVATNADLKQQIKEDAFREDLFYRLSVIDITLPPLRKRKEDIPLLVEHFIQKHGDGSRRITTQAMEALMDFQWPGNVRQLENEMLRAVVLSEEEIRLDHLSEELVSGAGRIYESVADFDLADQVDRLKRRLVSQAMRKVGGNQTAAAELLGLSRYGLQKMLKRFGI
jgi:serine/threonine-protein kinase PknK